MKKLVMGAVLTAVWWIGTLSAEAKDTPVGPPTLVQHSRSEGDRTARVEDSAGLIGSPPRISAVAQARQCRKLCRGDTHPCDPIVFKVTDGRCKVSRNR